MKAGRFREDLYYRLRVFPIRIPALRERLEDVPALARHLVRRAAAQMGKHVEDPTPEALALLARYPFPGNVRELANELERAVFASTSSCPTLRPTSPAYAPSVAPSGQPGLSHAQRSTGTCATRPKSRPSHQGSSARRRSVATRTGTGASHAKSGCGAHHSAASARSPLASARPAATSRLRGRAASSS